MSPLSPQSPSPARATRQKNTLFCPSCGHASGTDGDWRTQATASGVVFTCPVCDAEVTTRPVDRAPRSSVQSASAGSTLLGRAVGVAFAWTAWQCPYLAVGSGSGHR